MKSTVQNLINKCGCIDIKVVVILFFLLAILYSQYGWLVQTNEDCDCKSK